MSDQAERTHLRARAPFDKAAAALEETLQAFVRLNQDAKHTITRCAARLAELQGELADTGYAVGAAAAAKVPKVRPSHERERPVIEWCHCSMFASPHQHMKRREEPDEVAP